MTSRRLRVLLAGVAVAAGVATAGFVSATTATADPISNGAIAQIATQPVNSVRYCVIPTGELRRCGSAPAPATRCVVYDPRVLPLNPPPDNRIVSSTSIAACSSRPESHTWLRIMQR